MLEFGIRASPSTAYSWASITLRSSPVRASKNRMPPPLVSGDKLLAVGGVDQRLATPRCPVPGGAEHLVGPAKDRRRIDRLCHDGVRSLRFEQADDLLVPQPAGIG